MNCKLQQYTSEGCLIRGRPAQMWDGVANYLASVSWISISRHPYESSTNSVVTNQFEECGFADLMSNGQRSDSVQPAIPF